MEWVGLSGCLTLSMAFIVRARQYRKANRRTEARYALAMVIYLLLFSWFIVDYYSTKSILTTIVNAIPVEFAISAVIIFHICLLAYSIKHPSFENKVQWSEGKKSFFRHVLILAEASLICAYCYLGVLFRDASLVLASESGNYAEVQRSLALGADPAGDKAGGIMDIPVNACLEGALDRGNSRIAELLIAHGASLEEPDTMSHLTPLMYEVGRHDRWAVVFLMDHDVNINQTTGNGLTALKFASSDTGIAQLLVKHGVFVNTAAHNGSTALFDFARAGNASGVQYLIENGAYIRAVTKSGFTPLMAAAKSGNTATAAELIRAGVNYRLADSSGHDALWYAVVGKHKELARLLEHTLKGNSSAMALHKRELNDTLTL